MAANASASDGGHAHQGLCVNRSQDYYQHSRGKLRHLLATWSSRVRQEIVTMFLAHFDPADTDRVIDVGVSAESATEANAFERFYPHRRCLFGLGIEDLWSVRTAYSTVRFVMGTALALPFKKEGFDFAVSHATVEHVGTRKEQAHFVSELLRVADGCMVTTPNRRFPIELHTFLPFAHYLPPRLYRSLLAFLGFEFYAQEANLNLLNARELEALFPATVRVQIKATRLRTNLVAFASRSHDDCKRERR